MREREKYRLWFIYEVFPQKAHVLKAWMPAVGLLGSDWIMRAINLISRLIQ
jgi:hypothetical protein